MPGLVQAWQSTNNAATPTDGVTVTWGASRGVGNLLILICASDGVFSIPSGWTSAVQALDLADMRIMYRIADNTATDAPTIDNNVSTNIAWAEYTGYTATPLDKTASGVNNTISGAQTRSTGTTAATTHAGELIVGAWYYSSNEISGGNQFSGHTNGHVEVVDTGTTVGGGAQNVGLSVAVTEGPYVGTYESTASITMGAAAGSEGLGGAVATFRAVSTASVIVETGTFGTGTGLPASSVNVTSLSFTPKFILFLWGGRTAAGAAEGDHKWGMGYAVSSSDRGGVTSQSDHAATTMAADSQEFDDSCIKMLTITGTVDGAMDFTSMNSGGFTMVVDDAFAANYLVHYIAFGGADITNAASAQINLSSGDKTTIGFQPDVAFVFCRGETATAVNVSSGWSTYSFGVVDTALTNYVLAGSTEDGQPDSDTESYCRAGECLADAGNGIVSMRGAITAWLSNGFTYSDIESGGSTITARVLCVKGGRWKAGDILSATGVGAFGETGVGFTPVGGVFASHNKAQSTADTVQATDERSVGFAVQNAQVIVQNYVAVLDKDGSAAADVGVSQNTTGCYGNLSTATTIAVEGVGGVTAFGPDGFTFQMSDADPVQSFIWYLLVGPSQDAPEAYARPFGVRGQRHMTQLLAT